eukprot:gnl/Chilomastix_caulleri/2736.p2 GENE.gnl/Chilomastix_caulleri/2736~~gnl/Chilomastix_caulleri/2736.p2  ORF type:complete len:58 (+),score=5.57 gnl/Chilomastix_caulleri/2736:659-832(+)
MQNPQVTMEGSYPVQPIIYPQVSPPPPIPLSQLPPSSVNNPYIIMDVPDVPDDYKPE